MSEELFPNPSDKIDKLTNTFSADRRYCDELLRSSLSNTICKMLIYINWMRQFFPKLQEALVHIIPIHFDPSNQKDAESWTLSLIGGISKDISLIFYLSIRKLASEACFVARRSLEHIGVLSHFWYNPQKASFLEKGNKKDYHNAFINERDDAKKKELKAKNILKRFVCMTNPEVVSRLYGLISAADAHGGTLYNIALSEMSPNIFSCGFIHRDSLEDNHRLQLLQIACEYFVIDTIVIYLHHSEQYKLKNDDLDKGAGMIFDLVSPNSFQMEQAISSILADLNVK